MAKRNTEIGPYTGAPVVGLDLKAARRSVLMQAGMISPRKRYASAEERKEARKARSKSRREERKKFLESKGLGLVPRATKLTKAQKKERSKALRRMRNIYLREHPQEAKKLGIDTRRLRV